MSHKPNLIVIGGGLAGCEAAWQASLLGIDVTLFEMRPVKTTPAHKSDYLAELVCSNSLGADRPETAAGILKQELRALNSLIMQAADAHKIPAGGALAVDREKFAAQISQTLANQPDVNIIRREVTDISLDTPTIISSGPLTSDALAQQLQPLVGDERLYFYDAISPIICADSINYDKAFRASRYGRGGDDYLNCPLTEEGYQNFYRELINAAQHQAKDFEKQRFFEGCMPVEEIARRGEKTLLFGPMKPVGLTDPLTCRRPFAVVQLRMENQIGDMYNLVGFQTSLKWGEQKRIFGLIPGLEKAEYLRYGSLHRNTFINAPLVLTPTLQHKAHPLLFFAGQITGVEGYLESTAMGLMAGIYAARMLRGQSLDLMPETTAIGSLIKYITCADPKHFQPMNINLGIFPPLERRIRDKAERAAEIGRRAVRDLGGWKEGISF
ncbi:MAG: methylenetetrahydrofolate--tRNA-(uracil(54)-C(5))-methyltransferase (FADH(2)-oxidizing) TrmFO [Candidatus Schekmanbacteria bacterium]|nr:methylenetetrahydrofolate--tRNA-(uracil(54)-C(5))-methyltransferase (FADH(2)-oxidizing) TrmFO [Candidatus Schekmanbacteria bacterium]